VIEPGNLPKMRRRRTRRHRRNRLIRRGLLAACLVILVGGVSALTLKYLAPSLFWAQTAPPTFQQAELSRERVLNLNQLLSEVAPAENRPVYPYSVIPGGVEDAKELKWIAEHDPVVAAHYAGFDYDHAHVVRLTLAQTVYLSYRIGNHIYWTRHRLTLHKGEKLLTDGKITARVRCANRVEELPQQAASRNEPPMVKFDQPIGTGTALQVPPVPFQSALLERPTGQPGPLSVYAPIGGTGWVPISPPSLPPGGLCSPDKKKGGKESGCCSGIEGGGGTKKKGGGSPCAPGVVPEPGTWVLFATGLIVIFWQARRKLANGRVVAI
jgi:PEP-CTERM motif